MKRYSFTCLIPVLIMVVAGTIPSVMLFEHLPTAQPAASPEYNPDFFFNGFSEDCVVPCWYGLVVGETSEEETLAFLESLDPPEGVKEDIHFLKEPYNSWYIVKPYPVENTRAEDITRISIRAYFDDKILQGILFHISGNGIYDILPKRVTNTIGVPTEVYVLQANYSGYNSLLLSYDLGIYFNYSVQFDILSFTNPVHEFCLNGEQWHGYLPILVISIINPNATGIKSLTVEGINSLNSYVSLDEVSDLSLEEFTEALQNNVPVCLKLAGTVPTVVPSQEE